MTQHVVPVEEWLDLLTQRSTLEERAEKAEAERDAAERHIKVLADERTAAQTEADSLRSDLAAARAEIERLRSELLARISSDAESPALHSQAAAAETKATGPHILVHEAMWNQMKEQVAQAAAATRLAEEVHKGMGKWDPEKENWPSVVGISMSTLRAYLAYRAARTGAPDLGAERARLAVELAEARDAAEAAKKHGSFDEQVAAFKREAAAEQAWRARAKEPGT